MGGIVRETLMLLDKAIFGLLESAYNLIYSLSGIFINNDIAKKVITNLYIVVGIFALFRIALLLINSIIDPEKLNEKGKGLSNILVRTVIMIVLLLFTPMLFQMAYDLQARVVGWEIDKKGEFVKDENGEIITNKGNIIEKLILGEKAATSSKAGNMKPGEQFESIALSALITVNENYGNEFRADGEYVGYKSTEKCSTQKCESAIIEWNKMYANGKMDINTLSRYIGVAEKIDICDENGENCEKEKTYVYDYTIILTTFVAGFIVYVLFSFALDIAARVFQLAALEIVSPLFIVTFIDPKSASSGSFNRWLKEVGSTYAGLFIRLACVSLLLLFTSILNSLEWVKNGDNSFRWTKLTLLLGLLLFAKKAPKLISDMLGMKSDGMGLGIGKKLAGMAMVGGLAEKGLQAAKKLPKAVANKGITGARNLAAYKRLHDQNKSDNPELSTLNRRNKMRKDLAAEKARDARNRRYLDLRHQGLAPEDAKAVLDTERNKINKQAKKEANKAMSDKLKGTGLGAGAVAVGVLDALNAKGSFSGGFNSKGMKGFLKASNDSAKAYRLSAGTPGATIGEKIENKLNTKKQKILSTAYGSEAVRQKRAEDLQDYLDMVNMYHGGNGIAPKATKYEAGTKSNNGIQNGPMIVGADNDERAAMLQLQTKFNIDSNSIKLNADGRIEGYTGKDGRFVSMGESSSSENRTEVKKLAKEYNDSLSAYGLAKTLKFSTDLESKLINEYGSRLNDLTSAQQQISNAEASISNALNRSLSSLAFNNLGLSDVTIDNISSRIAELSSSDNTNDKESAEELKKIRNTMGAINGILYENGNIVYNDVTYEPNEFKNYVSTLGSTPEGIMLSQSLQYNIVAAQSSKDMAETQNLISGIKNAAEGAKNVLDYTTGLIDTSKPAMSGTLSQIAEIRTTKSNKNFSAIEKSEKEKGNVKEANNG